MNKNTKAKLNTLGQIIEDKGISYTKLAAHLGVSRQAIWQRLHQPYKESHISLIFFVQLGRLLDIDPIDMIKEVLKNSVKNR